jgi:hypothetical protein
MQTRRLRLGDVVDDYCPRERRLSNHVIVAMVDDAIKQTRCTTCDFEHPYKDGKLPARRKKKDATAALYEQVLEGMTDKPLLAAAAAPDEPPSGGVEPRAVEPAVPVAASAPVPTTPAVTDRPKSANLRSRSRAKAPAAAAPVVGVDAPPADVPSRAVVAPRVATPHPTHAPRIAPPPHAASASSPSPSESGSHAVAPDQTAGPDQDVDAPAGESEPLHRRTLIRATLPRPVGEVPVRQAPTFTIREAARAPKFRRPFARNARPQSGQNGVMNGPSGRQGARGPQARGKKGGAPHGAQSHGAQHGGHRFGQGQGSGGHQGAHHAKGRHGGQGNKRFK